MLFSNQFTTGSSWAEISVKPRQDLIAVTLRGFSQFPRDLRQLSVLSVWVLVPRSSCRLQFFSLQWLFSKLLCVVSSCAFTSKDSSRVLTTEDTTKKENHGLRRYTVQLDGIFRTCVVFFCYSRTCLFTEDLGASESMSSKTATNDNNHLYIYIFI